MCPCPWSPAAGSGAAHSDAGRVLRPPLSWVQSLCGREELTPHQGSRVILRDRQEQNSLPACLLAAPIWGWQMGADTHRRKKAGGGCAVLHRGGPGLTGEGQRATAAGVQEAGAGRSRPTITPEAPVWGPGSLEDTRGPSAHRSAPRRQRAPGHGLCLPSFCCCARGPRRAEAQLRLHPPGDPGPGPTVLLPGDSGLQGASTATPALQEGTSLWEQSSLPLFDWLPHPHPASPAPEIYANPTAGLFLNVKRRRMNVRFGLSLSQ